MSPCASVVRPLNLPGAEIAGNRWTNSLARKPSIRGDARVEPADHTEHLGITAHVNRSGSYCGTKCADLRHRTTGLHYDAFGQLRCSTLAEPAIARDVDRDSRAQRRKVQPAVTKANELAVEIHCLAAQ